jgi:hypothetical protein
MAKQRIQDSIASNGTLTPFLDGAAWEGQKLSPINSLAFEAYEIIQVSGLSQFAMLVTMLTGTANILKTAKRVKCFLVAAVRPLPTSNDDHIIMKDTNVSITQGLTAKTPKRLWQPQT